MIDRKLKSYLIICPTCSKSRFVAYSQDWNIRTGKCGMQCISCKLKSTPNSGWFKKGRKGYCYWTGKKRSKETVEKHRVWMVTNCPMRGKKTSDPAKYKMRLAKLGKYGALASRWEGGKTQGQKVRMLAPYKQWHKDVLKRDDYTCQMCFIRGGKLEVDHIKSFSGYPELRLELSNGRTLCKPCHKKTPTYCRGKDYDVVAL